jgi:hypothetical protein
MENTNDGGQAFPLPELGMHGSYGMTLRDYFAAKAMPIAASNFPDGHPNGFAGMAAWAYSYADAMLVARDKQL